ncbi:MAG: phosphate/phosphite/phosphonate ABC transporter substrate-binding protein [Candidatus Latescibacterota bacterium]
MANTLNHTYIHIILILFLLGGSTPYAQTDEQMPLPIGFMDYTFSGISKEDTQVAVDFYLQKLFKHTGNIPKAISFNDIEVLRQSLKNKDVLMATLSATDFLRLQPDSLLQPLIVRITKDGSFFDRYVVLVHKNKQWSSLEDLENASLRVQANNDLISKWIQVELAQKKRPSATQFFDTITQDLRPSQSVLAVFFGKSDACIVNTSVFETMSQLNPQISQQLVPIITSPEFLTGFLCAHTDMDPNRKKILTESTLALSQSEDGRQVIRLFKTQDVTLFQESYFKTVLELFDQYKKYYGTTDLSF